MKSNISNVETALLQLSFSTSAMGPKDEERESLPTCNLELPEYSGLSGYQKDLMGLDLFLPHDAVPADLYLRSEENGSTDVSSQLFDSTSTQAIHPRLSGTSRTVSVNATQSHAETSEHAESESSSSPGSPSGTSDLPSHYYETSPTSVQASQSTKEPDSKPFVDGYKNRLGLQVPPVERAKKLDSTTSSDSIYQAIRTNDLTRVRVLLAGGANIETRSDRDQKTCVILAASLGIVRILEFLLEQGASVDAVDINGRTALHYAASEGFQKCAVHLLESGASVNILDFQYEHPLHRAVRYGQEEMVKLMLPIYSTPMKTMISNKTILHTAAEFDRFEIIKLICDRIREHEDNCTSSGVATASKTCCSATFPGSDSKDTTCRTPFQVALSWNRPRSVFWLQRILQSGVNKPMFTFQHRTSLTTNTWKPKAIDWEMPLHYAFRKSKIDLITVLLMIGADISLKNSMDQTPFSRKNRRSKTKKYLFGRLHAVVRSGRHDAVKKLLEEGHDPEEVNEDGLLATETSYEAAPISGLDLEVATGDINICKALVLIAIMDRLGPDTIIQSNPRPPERDKTEKHRISRKQRSRNQFL